MLTRESKDAPLPMEWGQAEERIGRADAVLIGAALLALVGAAAYLLHEPAPHRAVGAAEIGSLSFARGVVRRRPGETLVWGSADTGDDLYHRDTIFVPPGSHAVVELRDGARIEVDEDSLVVLVLRETSGDRDGSAPGDGTDGTDGTDATVRLERGTISGHAGANRGLEVETGQGRMALAAGARANLRVDGSRQVEVDLLLGAGTLTAGATTSRFDGPTSLRVDGQGRVAPPQHLGAELLEPADNQRFYFAGEPTEIALKWRGAPGQRAEVALDRGFSKEKQHSPWDADHLLMTPRLETTYYWRVVDARGEPVSVVRKILALRCPVAVSAAPQAGESVSIHLDRSVLFLWAAAPGESSYWIEVAPEGAFASPAIRRETRNTAIWLREGLREGPYAWRICGQEAQSHGCPCSRQVPFRVLEKPVPEVLQLFDAEFQRGAREP